MALIPGYPKGSNITILDCHYEYPKRMEDGKYSDDIMTVCFKDLNTGKKHIVQIKHPEYRFFETKDDVYIDHNLFFIEEDQVEEKRVPYAELLKYIAKETDNLDYFYNNIKTGNRRENENLHMIPKIFNSDMHIEDAYRFYFDLEYKNETFTPTKAYLDIETDNTFMQGDFPEMGECPINALSYIDVESRKIHSFLLRNPNNPQVAEFESNLVIGDVFKEFKDYMIDHVNKINPKNSRKYFIDEFNIEFYFYDEEINLIADVFKIINFREPDFVLAWNMSFDIPYIIERIKVLGYDPAEIMCHPEVEHKVAKYYIDERNKNMPAQRGDYFTILGKTVYLDQLVHFASRRKGQSAFDNLKLDYIAKIVADVGKLDWSGFAKSFTDFETNFYKLFVFYNAIDTIAQHCIEEKVNDIGYIFNKCLINNTRYHKGHRQTVYLTNRGIKDFRADGYIMGNNVNRKNEKPPKFLGALVGDPLNNTDYPKMILNGEPINIVDNADDFDFKSLYPSTMREFNIAPNTQIGKIEIDEEVHEQENPFNYDKYCRGGQFLQDFYSDNYIEFCHRWFHLANFKEMLEDMDEVFREFTPAGKRDINEPENVIVWFDKMIPQEESNVITHHYNTENNSVISWYPGKRDFSEEINTLRNTAQMDIDNIDMIMRRKQREKEEDDALETLFAEASGTVKDSSSEGEEGEEE